MKVQLAVCAKDLPEAASYQAVVVLTQDPSTSLGVSEASSTTTDPVWNRLVCPADDLADDTSLTVKICKAGSTDDVVATASFVLGQVSQSYYQAAAKFSAEDGDAGAKIALSAAKPTTGTLSFQLAASDLPDTDFGMFRKQHTDGMYEVYSASTGKKLIRSNCVEDDLFPTWDVMELDLDLLCGGRLDAPIRITVLDKDAGDVTQYLGQVMLTVNQILGQGDGVLKHYPLVKGGTASSQGSLSVKQAQLLPAEFVSREVHKHLQLVMTALDSKRDELVDVAAAKKTAAEQAQAAVATAQSAVDALQAKMQDVAAAQSAVQTKLTGLKQEHAKLQAVATSTPCTGKVLLQLAAKDLPDTDFGIRNKTDPIFELVVDKKSVVRSNIVENDLNPVWDAVTVDLGTLGGSLDKAFTVIVSDKDGGKDKSSLGSTSVTVNQLIKAVGSAKGMALPPTKKGFLLVQKAEVSNLVDHVAQAKAYYDASIAPVATECATATQAFEAARTEMDAARAKVATAQEDAQVAQDAAEAAQLALEMMEKEG